MSTYSKKAAALFDYLPEATVLTGLPVVTVGLTPRALSERSGIRWTDDDTELGPSVSSVFRLRFGGPRFSLRSWENAPYPGVTVSCDATAKERDVDMLLARLEVAKDEIIDRVPVRVAQPAVRRAGLSPKAALVEAVANDSGLSTADSARAIVLLDTVATLRKGRRGHHRRVRQVLGGQESRPSRRQSSNRREDQNQSFEGSEVHGRSAEAERAT